MFYYIICCLFFILALRRLSVKQSVHHFGPGFSTCHSWRDSASHPCLLISMFICNADILVNIVNITLFTSKNMRIGHRSMLMSSAARVCWFLFHGYQNTQPNYCSTDISVLFLVIFLIALPPLHSSPSSPTLPRDFRCRGTCAPSLKACERLLCNEAASLWQKSRLFLPRSAWFFSTRRATVWGLVPLSLRQRINCIPIVSDSNACSLFFFT